MKNQKFLVLCLLVLSACIPDQKISKDIVTPTATPTSTSNISIGTSANRPIAINDIPKKKFWKLTMVDDFKGKPSSTTENNYCYDQLKAQCHIWAGSESFPCDLSQAPNTDLWQPTIINMKAVIKSIEPSFSLSGLSDAQIRTKYGLIVNNNWKDINKCLWTGYTMVNWMATDYNGKWSARMDPSMVSVDTAGKGYLKLKGKYAPITDQCVFGGVYGATSGGGYCYLPPVSNSPAFNPTVSYFVDSGFNTAGIYYNKINGGCPHGGSGSLHCKVYSFANGVVEPNVNYTAAISGDGRAMVYYNNNIKYACRENIEYPNGGVYFKKLTCPILNGAVLSSKFTNMPSRGFNQKYGRFETKLRIPKGRGAFPAAWLLPNKGGWPYSGGEIDIMEARDNADETYQTYHDGKCVENSSITEIVTDPRSGKAVENGECQTIGNATSFQLSKGHTLKQLKTDEFNLRDHVYSAEWDEKEIRYYTNNKLTHSIQRQMLAETINSLGGTLSKTSLTEDLKKFKDHNFPPNPMYWILNHSTYVGDSYLAGWATQTVLFDYVKTYSECKTQEDFCPSGGTFNESNETCTKTSSGDTGSQLERTVGQIYSSPCHPKKESCFLGGTKAGPNCQVKNYGAQNSGATKYLVQGVNYWVDSDPRWPGVYYAKINGSCPHGGSGSVNCQLDAFSSDFLEEGVTYWVDTDPRWPGVYYAPDDF